MKKPVEGASSGLDALSVWPGVVAVGLLASAVYISGIVIVPDAIGDGISIDPSLAATLPVAAGVLAVLLAVGYGIHRQLTNEMAGLGIPFFPSSLPFIGHGIAFFLESPWNHLLRWHREMGDILIFPLLGRKVVSLANPSHLRLALQSKIRSVKKDVGFTYSPFLVILGKGIVTSEGQEWMKQRLKMSTVLRVKVLERIPDYTLTAVQRLMDTLDEAAVSGEPVEMGEALRHLTLQVISKTFLSIDADESDSTFGKLYLPIVDECNTRVWHPYREACFFLPFWWRHQYNLYKLNTYVSKLILQRWNARKTNKVRHDDILDLVIDAYETEHPDKNDLSQQSVKQMRDEFKTFILAGHETSAAMMTWALNELMANKTIMTKVRSFMPFELTPIHLACIPAWHLSL